MGIPIFVSLLRDSYKFWTSRILGCVGESKCASIRESSGEEGITPLLLFTVAMLLHFIVNDYGLWEHHKYNAVAVG